MNNSDKKIRLALIFGGQSSEHDVSCVSASTVAGVLDRDKYDITFIGITRDGHWLLVEDESEISGREWEKDVVEAADTEEKAAVLERLPKAIISPDTDHSLLIKKNGVYEKKELDVALPILHGLFGEDGTIQGLSEMAYIYLMLDVDICPLLLLWISSSGSNT